MKKLMNKIFLILGILFMVFVLFGNENYAANATISCTSTSETNKKVTIYVPVVVGVYSPLKLIPMLLS